jgi:ferredoxin
MRIRLDIDRCVGHGRCYDLAAPLFEADERGHCRIRAAQVPAAHAALARHAVANCPEDALALDED